MHMFGRANWWLPRSIDKRLPHLSVEPPEDAVPDRTTTEPVGVGR
jgi:RND superfamily putative drug exporter